MGSHKHLATALRPYPVEFAASCPHFSTTDFEAYPDGQRSVHLVCPFCHIPNMIPQGQQPERCFCQRCGGLLFANVVADLTPKRYYTHLRYSDIPVAVLFWSPNSYESARINDEFEVAATRLEPGVRFARMNADEYENIARRSHVVRLPRLVIFRNEREIARWKHEVPVPDLVHWIRAHLGSPSSGYSMARKESASGKGKQSP